MKIVYRKVLRVIATGYKPSRKLLLECGHTRLSLSKRVPSDVGCLECSRTPQSAIRIPKSKEAACR